MPQQQLLFFGEVTHDIVREYDIGGANGAIPLFFIPLVPYPARSARHLPHAAEAGWE